jgi:hypothetical protein
MHENKALKARYIKAQAVGSGQKMNKLFNQAL